MKEMKMMLICVDKMSHWQNYKGGICPQNAYIQWVLKSSTTFVHTIKEKPMREVNSTDGKN
jgi:hypothetical protein